MKKLKYLIAIGCVCCCATATISTLTSCDDMLSMGNEDVIYADENHLTHASDTVNSFVGILAQLQKIGVRTNLFGELRGDLINVDPSAKMSLKEISEFNVSDDNEYNNPRDYYAIINNCNYYLANADTALLEQKYNNGARQDFYPFRAEYYSVRAIRAWVYLQLGQIYGDNIPVITEPMLSLEDDVAQNAPRMSLSAICDYFIQDLLPYRDMSKFAYPYHGNPGNAGYNSHTPSRLSVFPVSLVLGDLYLWAASIQQNPMLAREAAKCYFDYIDWIPVDAKYKERNFTSTNATRWDQRCFTTGNFLTTEWTSVYGTTRFGNEGDECITVIAMDSSSAEGHYNELRKLYCYDYEATEPAAAPLVPSQPCLDYSDSQVYYGRYQDGTGSYSYMPVESSMLEEIMLQEHYLGDLRLAENLSKYTNNRGVELQTIYKISNAQDVVIYRTGQVYLRLAEALNYAGFPKFALAILTSGLDNVVIEHDVLSQVNNAADSAFISYFDFNTAYYNTRIVSYTNSGGYNYRVDLSAYNQIGLHERGSGWAMENPYYYPYEIDVPQDFTGYPIMPPPYVPVNTTTPSTIVENLLAEDSLLIYGYAIPAGLVPPDPVAKPEEGYYQVDVNNASIAYNTALRAFADSLYNDYTIKATLWYRDYGVPQVHARQVEVLDSLIDVEQALETCFEGQRFGDLMRAAYRCGDDRYVASHLAKRNPALAGLTRQRWFIQWNGQIGR